MPFKPIELSVSARFHRYEAAKIADDGLTFSVWPNSGTGPHELHQPSAFVSGMTSSDQLIFLDSDKRYSLRTIEDNDSFLAFLRDGVAQDQTSLRISPLECPSCLQQSRYLPTIPRPFPSTPHELASPQICCHLPVIFRTHNPKTGIGAPPTMPFSAQSLFTGSSPNTAHYYPLNPSRNSSIMPQLPLAEPTAPQSNLRTTASPTLTPGLPKKPKLVINHLLPKYRTEKHIIFSIGLVEGDGLGASSDSSGERYQSKASLLFKKFIQVPRTANVRPTKHLIDPASLFVLSEETFCATNPVYHQHKVPCCGSCQMRERRNQNKQGTQPSIPASSVTTSESNPPFTPSTHTTGYLSPVDFVCPEIIECKGGKAWIRMRITCYCSHHQETTGFCVRLTLKDHLGQTVATTTTPPIMIKDDHKRTRVSEDDDKRESTSVTSKRPRTTTRNDQCDEKGRIPGISHPEGAPSYPNRIRDEGDFTGESIIPADCVVLSQATDYDRRFGPMPNQIPTFSIVSTATPVPNLSPHDEYPSFRPLNVAHRSSYSSLPNSHHHIDDNQLARGINIGETDRRLGYNNGTANWNMSQDLPRFH